jgi:hypothetical protein
MAGQDPIHIKASRRGTFLAAATAHHMTGRELAHDVEAHPGDFSPAMRKKAEFAENIAYHGE